MRKNGVDKTLTLIEGGVCAPEGFLAGGYHCGISAYGSVTLNGGNSRDIREDLALIKADRKYPTACAFTTAGVCGAPVIVSKYNIRHGYASAMFCNSGIANVLQEQGEDMAKAICFALEEKGKISRDEVVITSTGSFAQNYPYEMVMNGIAGLVKNLGRSHEHSLAAARAMMTTDRHVKQVSYSFALGAYTCKIGAIFKGGAHVCPNMATTLCFITTDVNVSPKMLQRAFNFAVADGFNQICIDGVSSPNDTACIMASGKAGNYIVDCVDSEYRKFSYALSETVKRICKILVADSGKKTFSCTVSGIRSKQLARTLSKQIVSSIAIRHSLAKGLIDPADIICLATTLSEFTHVEDIKISVKCEDTRIVISEDTGALPYQNSFQEKLKNANEIEILVAFREGNYSASAFGVLDVDI
ncbi:MAG: bifunctional ornithine acetyltransferase/N-acetylglutamate synthase [Clostridia bacterium]|nr:bifunctional ornithine acetyltransferase/N-acetylglutamate synthase [Clostridia bacterium]